MLNLDCNVGGDSYIPFLHMPAGAHSYKDRKSRRELVGRRICRLEPEPSSLPTHWRFLRDKLDSKLSDNCQEFWAANIWECTIDPCPQSSCKNIVIHKGVHAMQMGGVYTSSNQEKSTLLQKCCDRSGRCIAIPFLSEVDLTLLKNNHHKLRQTLLGPVLCIG